MCLETCLDRRRVKGKIVICDGGLPYNVAFKAGALGVVAKDGSVGNISSVYPLPAASLKSADFEALKSYYNSTKAPTANILKSETLNDTSAPLVARFSSRGPNKIASDILKPDIAAPGVNILAAYSPQALLSPLDFPDDKRKVPYFVLSGTSMACPHVAGAAAYVKSVHPDWSPSAIKSSLMTTADTMRTLELSDAEFAYGSGHMNPIKALNPGLVYETTQNDYIKFLCKLGYHKDLIISFTGHMNVTCPKKLRSQSPNDVNYPSMSAIVGSGKPFSVKFTRSVTNFGSANSTYTAKVTSGSKVRITVEPSSLSFKSFKEIKSYNVSVVGKRIPKRSLVSASLVWTDGVHSVRSPIIVYTTYNDLCSDSRLPVQ